jgi:hypothetical protein
MLVDRFVPGCQFFQFVCVQTQISGADASLPAQFDQAGKKRQNGPGIFACRGLLEIQAYLFCQSGFGFSVGRCHYLIQNLTGKRVHNSPFLVPPCVAGS